MKRHYFQRFMLAVLAVALMAASAQAAPMTSAEKESIYSSAILNLETYIESYGESDISLTGIEEAFSGLGRYEQSASLLSYTKILEKLQNDTYDYELMLQLQMLDKDAKFKGYLAETLKGSAIGSVEELTLYASGREHEYNQQLEAAIADYEKCLSFFDANIRYFSLQSGQDKDAYERANALLAAGDFAGAYYAFGRTNRYQDSESRRAAIADMIGYVPASETDNPEPVTRLKAEATATEIKLVWNKARHASGYRVTYRQSGEAQWHTTDCGVVTSYTFTNLFPNTEYEFSVVALAGRVNTEQGFVRTTTRLMVIEINEKNFPDDNFRTYIRENFDKNHDRILDDQEYRCVTVINCSGKSIADLTGIEYFVNLTTLYCRSNRLKSLDVSNNIALTDLRCNGNHLTSLDVSNNIALTILICHSNRLKSLIVRRNTALMTLDCSSNQLASLDVSKNVTLTSLKCSSNKLMALDVSNNTDLSMLECAQNNLISLDVSKNTALTGLNCSSNQLTTLDLRMNKALTVLICYSNMIKTVDLTKNKEIKWQQVGDTIIQK